MDRVGGFVLVGGRSLRMGEDKARLRFRSRYLVEIIAQAVAEAAGWVALVGNPAAFTDLPWRCLADLHPGEGPLAGLETALASGLAEFNLIVGCDMPGILPADLRRLLAAAEQSGGICTVATDAGGKKQPLCGVYRSPALPIVRAALAEGRLRLRDLMEELKAGEVRIDGELTNLNTPDQWSAWLATH